MFDISQEEDYRELTLEEQYLVNGGERIENSDAAVAAGAPGDVLKRNDGSEVVITQGDINAAQKKLGLTGSGGNPGEGNGGVTGSGGNNNTSTSSGGPSGNPGGSGPDNSSKNNNPFANSNTPWGAAEQMEAARLAKERGKEFLVKNYKTVSAKTVKEKDEPSFLEKAFTKFLKIFVPEEQLKIHCLGDNNPPSFYYKEPKTKNLFKYNNANNLLLQFSVGTRKSTILGYSLSTGIVVNRNNLWDSGVLLSGGLGLGFERNIGITGKVKLDKAIDITTSTIDFTKPTSTADIEGASLNCYTSAGMGISVDMNNKQLKGIQAGAIGGGVYYEKTMVITAGEVGEALYNIGPFILNSICKVTGMNRFVALDYIELDGK